MPFRRHFFIFLIAVSVMPLPAQWGATDGYLDFQSAAQLRTFMSWTPERAPLISAHRGGPAPGYPENCLETLAHTLSRVPSLMEIDVRMTRDSVLVLMHDERIDRTTTGSGAVDSLALADLRALRLRDNGGAVTDYRIPTLREALAWADGRTILKLDVKRTIDPARVVALIEEMDAAAHVIVITYGVESAERYYGLNPDLMLSISLGDMAALDRLRAGRINPAAVLAFVGVSEPEPDLYARLHDAGISTILATIGNLDRMAARRGGQVYRRLVDEGADMLSTDYPDRVYDAIRDRMALPLRD